jgi:hypothetical protein
MDANGKGHTMELTFRGLCLENRCAETEHKWNIEIEALSMKTHTVNVINI